MDFKKFSCLLVEFAEQNMDSWNDLDGAQGDGDLGVTIVLGAKALADTAQKCSTLKQWLLEGGKSLRKAAPSTMGILIASSLLAAGKAIHEEKEAYTLEEWAVIQQTIVDEIQKRGGAELGDKTVLDALIPAVNTFRVGVEEGENLQQVLAVVVEVAKQSAVHTSTLVSKIGRSSWLGERAQGSIDGGAWVCFQLYDFILKQLINEGEIEDEKL